jgi:hypothetical protein
VIAFNLLTMEEKKCMFKTKVTGYVVAMLILFQSFTAVASSLDFHTPDVEHLAEVHEHDKQDAHASPQPEKNVTSLDLAASSESPHNPSDCHHCGHCHGSHTQWVGDSVGIKQPSLDEGHAFFYLSKVIDAPITRLLRPPKFTS